MTNYIKLFFLTFPIYLAIDFTWLGLIAKNFYDKSLVHFHRTLRWQAALLLYVLIVSAVIVVAVPKYLETGRLLDGFIWGSFMGLAMYGAYGLTNMSILSDWSWRIVIVDILWGMALCGTTGLVSSMFSKLIM